jgi:hypothetical protein
MRSTISSCLSSLPNISIRLTKQEIRTQSYNSDIRGSQGESVFQHSCAFIEQAIETSLTNSLITEPLLRIARFGTENGSKLGLLGDMFQREGLALMRLARFNDNKYIYQSCA